MKYLLLLSLMSCGYQVTKIGEKPKKFQYYSTTSYSCKKASSYYGNLTVLDCYNVQTGTIIENVS